MLLEQLRVLYLHGFASGPASRKATYFAAKFNECGANLEIPDLAQGDFRHLTITAQLDLIATLLDGSPAILIGSSLGGYLAALYAATHREIKRLILLAPALDFVRLWRQGLGTERLARWKRSGSMPVFHYAEGREMPLDFEFIQDAARFPPFPNLAQPTLIFHGRHDPVVPFWNSVLLAAAHYPEVHVRCLVSGHELTDVLDSIWLESQSFLTKGLPSKE
ncbi:MAG: alpha/beta fold hydrolase [Acidobacteriaceae bacterium]|nr:alpha/beta fold hydrolase [Acidobacteriaceae bacterium]